MFKINYNELLDQRLDESSFITHTKGKDFLEIKTRHVFVDIVQFPNTPPIDFLYRKEKDVESLFLVYSTNINTDEIVIDGRTNGSIVLKKSEDQPVPCGQKNIGSRYDYYYYFPITIEQLHQLSSYQRMDISANGTAKTSYDGNACSEFVFICKMMYREILYLLSFPEVNDYFRKTGEEIQTVLKKKNEIQNNKN